MNIKKMKTTHFLYFLLLTIIPYFGFSQGITSPNRDFAQLTQYKEESPIGSNNWVLMPNNRQDSVFIFCSDNDNCGTLVAPGTGTCTYEWGKYSPSNFQYVPFAYTQTVTGLQSGGYKVKVNCGGTITCYKAWVFCNKTIADVADIQAGCDVFQLSGVADKVADFTVYTPPADPISINSSTQIKVCFTAQHTFVSDLGFYLIAPGYGTGCPNATTPGNPGIVELLPSVAAWDDGVTGLPSTVFGCATASQIGTNCNSGNNVQNFCFTTSLAAGNPALTACVCDLPVPLTGNFASAGPWSTIYGQQVPAPLGTAPNCGWSVQIYDCIGQDVGYFTNATITFTGTGACGPATHYYDSGTISSTINDNSCTAASASRYVVPPANPYQYTITNTITSAVWSVSPGVWNPAWGSTSFLTNPNPSINPIPTQNTWFKLTVTDNLGCVKVDSAQFVTLPTDATINPAGPFCTDDTLQVMTAANTGGAWSSDPPGLVVNASAGIINPAFGAGTYNITYLISGLCGDTATSTVTINPVVTISNLTKTCVTSNVAQICFDISGGSSFTVSVNGGPFSADSISGNHFCYTIASPGDFNFEISNGLGCTNYVGTVSHDCSCITQAGSVTQTPIVLCQGQSTVAVTSTGFVDDGNDRLVYYLHEGSLNALVNPVDSNQTGIFTDANVVYGQMYYISPVAANISGGWIDLNDNCLDVGIGRPVKWLENPIANAGNDISFCGLSVQLNATTPNVGQGSWSSAGCPLATYLPYNDSPTAIATVPNTGSCVFTWTVANGQCTSTDNVTVNFIQTPNPYAGADTTICGLTYNLLGQLSLPAGQSSALWSGPGTFGNITNAQTTVTMNNYGTYTFTLTENVQSYCSAQDYITVTFIKPPMPDANHNDSVCGFTYNLNALNVIYGGYWTGPGSVVYTSSNGYNPPSKDPQAHVSVNYTGNSQTFEFVWHESNNLCNATDTVSINFALPPSAQINNTASQLFVCGNTAQVIADITGAPYTNALWFSNYAGASFSDDDNDTTSITIPTTGQYTDSGFVAVNVFWMMKNQGCDDIDTTTISFYKFPTPFAGIDTTACGLKLDSLNAKFSLGSNNQGIWTKISGPGTAIFTPNNSPKAQVIVSQYGTYRFVWRETNVAPGSVNCSNTDTIEVVFVEIPFFDAGDEIKHCGKLNIPLNATPSGVATSSTWVTHSGVQYVSQTSPTTTINTNFTGEFYATWMEWIGVCIVRDSVKITVVPQPVAVQTIPSWNRNVCGKVFKELTVQNPTAGMIGYWIDTVAGTTFNQVNHANVDTATVASYGMHNFYWIVSNTLNGKTCADTTDVVQIEFWKQPTPDAGQRYDTACGTKMLLEGIQSVSGSTITWSGTDVDLSFYSSNWGSTGNIPNDSVKCILPGAVRDIYLTEAVGPNGMCSTQDTITVKFARLPNGNFTYVAPKCFGGAFILTAVEDTLPKYTWDFAGGTLDSSSVANDNGEGPLYVSWDADSVHNVTLISTSSYKCNSTPVTIPLNEPPRIDVHFNKKDVRCGFPQGKVTAWATGGSAPNSGFVYNWLPNPQIEDVYNTTQDSLLPGAYYFRVVDYYNCIVVDTAIISSFGDVTANYTVAPDSGNAPLTVNVTNYSVDAALYRWYINNEESAIQYVTVDSINTGNANLIYPKTNAVPGYYYFNPSIKLPLGTILDVNSSLATSSQPTIEYPDGGKFWMFLIAISDSGCVDTMLFKHVKVNYLPTVEVPNVFTPNGDGINDRFVIKTLSLESFKGTIYNRWGKKVYEWDSPDDLGWDGTINGGSPASPGTYYYMIEAVGKDGKVFNPNTDNCKECKGFLQLIRDK